MVAWARVAALCGVMLACGGRSEWADSTETSEPSGGSGAAAPNGATAGTGGTSAGVGGATAPEVIPTAGTGAAGSWNGGGTSAGPGIGGASFGDPSGSHECPQGTTTEYAGPLPPSELRFRGTLNGEPVDLASDRMSSYSGCKGDTWTVELLFDGAFAGDQITLYFDASEGCFAQAWYVPEGADEQATVIRSALHLWSASERSSESRLPTQVLYGAVSIQALAADGSVTHVLEGELSLHVEYSFCID